MSEDLQISTLLKGDDARRFRLYKQNENLMKDAEAARKLILERLAEIDTEGPQRKPMARAAARAEARRLLVETLQEVLENVG